MEKKNKRVKELKGYEKELKKLMKNKCVKCYKKLHKKDDDDFKKTMRRIIGCCEKCEMDDNLKLIKLIKERNKNIKK